MKQVLLDILKVNDPEKSDADKFSQSRVYLFFSVITTLFLIVLSSFRIIDMESLTKAYDTLLFMMILFSGYALSGKIMKCVGNIKGEVEKIRSHVEPEKK